MAKPGVDLKSIARAIDDVDRKVRVLLQQKSATRAAKTDIGALRRALKGIRSKVTALCPPGMFRSFELGEAKTAMKRRRTGTTRSRRK